MDRRLHPANDRAALTGLEGRVAALRFTGGDPARLTAPLTDLCAAPAGPRERQLLYGDGVLVIDRHQGWAFVRADKDGYCGYLPATALGPPQKTTHAVAAPASHLYPEPRVQARELSPLPFGARVCVTGDAGNFAQTPDGFVPARHLRAIDDLFTDPVAVAALFLGTPYLWGGNSRAGIDCSGLVQAALLACGIPCPGDSDLQEALGGDVPDSAPLLPGDLIFWSGHVAMVADASRLIHATGHVMATVHESTEAAIARIAAQGQPVIARRRLHPQAL